MGLRRKWISDTHCSDRFVAFCLPTAYFHGSLEVPGYCRICQRRPRLTFFPHSPGLKQRPAALASHQSSLFYLNKMTFKYSPEKSILSELCCISRTTQCLRGCHCQPVSEAPIRQELAFPGQYEGWANCYKLGYLKRPRTTLYHRGGTLWMVFTLQVLNF